MESFVSCKTSIKIDLGGLDGEEIFVRYPLLGNIENQNMKNKKKALFIKSGLIQN